MFGRGYRVLRLDGCRLRFVKKITDRGVLTLPTEIREALSVEEGDIVEFEVLRVIKKAQPRPSPNPLSFTDKSIPSEATP